MDNDRIKFPILVLQSSLFCNPVLAMDGRIPLTFIGSWGFKDSTFPANAQANRDSSLAHHALASFILVTPDVALDMAANLPAAAQLPVMTLLQSREVHWVQKVDVCKPLAVYSVGGFYYDLADVKIARSVEPLREAGLVLHSGWGTEVVEADILGGRKQDPRLLDLMARCAKAALRALPSAYPSTTILRTTGPGMWSRWAEEHGLCGRVLSNRYARTKVPGTREVSWGAVHRSANAFFEIRHAQSWVDSTL